MSDDPRKLALMVLNRLKEAGKPLDRVLEEADADSGRLQRRDRALFNTLVHGVLRWQGRLDWIIRYFSNVPFKKIDSRVLNILRLATFQILFLHRVPESAAVNTAVEITKESAPGWVAGFVNGVLRNIARKHVTVSFPDVRQDPISAIAAEKSFPPWMTKRWVERFGENGALQLCDAMNEIPPITIRTNTLKISRNSLIDAIQPGVKACSPTRIAPDGVSIANPGMPIHRFAAFNDGWFQVQDEAAQLVTLLLDPQPGETVLDACAGLGGKTGHIAQLMKNDGMLIALDNDGEKLKRHEVEMQRLGVTNVISCRYDLNTPPDVPRRYHRVLLDAPCSGLGVLRRNPDAKWSTQRRDLKRHPERQLRFLHHLAGSVLPSGVMVYAVCSTEPEETEAVIGEFLKDCPEFGIDKDHGRLPESALAMVNPKGFLYTFPHRDRMDGFFSVRLKRVA